MKRLLDAGFVLLLVTAAPTVPGVTVSPDELAESRQWVAARLEGVAAPRTAGPALVVLANHDPVSKNARGGKPLRLAGQEFTRGLYGHAPSKILVRLPAPGNRFTAVVGVDSNEQTSGSRGSVDFSAQMAGAEKFRSGVLREGTAAKAVAVDLAGATEFGLQVDETPDGIACDQASWAEAKVTLQDGRELWLGDLPLHDARPRRLFSTDLPFSSWREVVNVECRDTTPIPLRRIATGRKVCLAAGRPIS